MASGKPPLVLFHGVAMTGECAWQDVVPLLAEQYQVFTPTALGHHGGPVPQRRPVTIADIVDAAERFLDEHGLDRPHLAGNSMGGFMAVELARRGRAASACAFSPAGFWAAGDGLQQQISKKFSRNLATARLARPVIPLMCRRPRLRRLLLRDMACKPDRISAARARQVFADFLACTVLVEIAERDFQTAPLDPLPCPITIAWSDMDRIIPRPRYEKNVRERLPQAVFKGLPGVGHVPMFDDPDLVVQTIVATTSASTK